MLNPKKFVKYSNGFSGILSIDRSTSTYIWQQEQVVCSNVKGKMALDSFEAKTSMFYSRGTQDPPFSKSRRIQIPMWNPIFLSSTLPYIYRPAPGLWAPEATLYMLAAVSLSSRVSSYGPGPCHHLNSPGPLLQKSNRCYLDQSTTLSPQPLCWFSRPDNELASLFAAHIVMCCYSRCPRCKNLFDDAAIIVMDFYAELCDIVSFIKEYICTIVINNNRTS
jgi:hypothetical protein